MLLGCSRTRIFSKSISLFEIPNVDFARYMDDMDFGVDTVAKAKSVLRDLDLTLHTRNIRLNSGKTKIMAGAEALTYFRARENLALLKLVERIKNGASSPKKVALYARLVRRMIRSGIVKKQFDEGSGGKILKRLLGIAYRNGFAIDDLSFRDIIYNRPALRDYLFRGWIRSPSYGARYRPLSRDIWAVDRRSMIIVRS